VLFDQGLPAV